MQEKKTKVFELIVSIIFICFSSYMLYVAYTSRANMGSYAAKEMHPFTFPKIVLYLMLFFAIICFSYSISWLIKNRTPKEEKTKTPILERFFFYVPKKSLVTYLLIVVYIAFWNLIGFTLSTFAYITVQTRFLDRERPIRQVLIVAALIAVGLTVLFSVLFRVNLPEPIFDLIF